jgi:amino acid transporter
MSETRGQAGQGPAPDDSAGPAGTARGHGLKRDLHVWEAIGLAEEAQNPQRAIPRAIGTSVVALAVFYTACIAIQSLGFGANPKGSAAFAGTGGATRAVFDRSLGVARWRGVLPAVAVILVLYVLYANVYPRPPSPFNVFPYVVLAWLVIGGAVIAVTPKLVRRVGAGLAQDLDLPAGRVVGELEPSSTDG